MKLSAVVAVLVLLAACARPPSLTSNSPSGSPAGDGTSTMSDESTPFDTQAQLRPDIMKIEPELTSPGKPIDVVFSEETMRGVHYVLEEQVGERWALRFHLISDWGEARQPEIFEAADPDFGVPDIGQGGTGPDRLSLPDALTPGNYRICTANSVPNICAPLRIEFDK